MRRSIILLLLALPSPALAQERLDRHGFPLPDGAIARLGDLRFAQPGRVNDLTLSADGKTAVTVGEDNRVLVWNIDTGRIVREIAADHFDHATLSRNGKLLAGTTRRGAALVRDLETGKPCWQLSGVEPHSYPDFDVLRFIDNDRLLVLASQHPSRVEIRNAENGGLVRTWTEKQLDGQLKEGNVFRNVALSPSGEVMAWLAGPDPETNVGLATVTVHETRTGKLLHTVKNLRRSRRAVLVDEGQTIVLDPGFMLGDMSKPHPGAGKYEVINVVDGKHRYYCDFRTVLSLTSRPNGYPGHLMGHFLRNRDALFTFDEQGMIRWDFATGEKREEFARGSLATAFSADGKRSVMARGCRLVVGDEHCRPLRWLADYAEVPWIRFLPDGRLSSRGWMHTWSEERRFDVWDLRKQRVVRSVLEDANDPRTYSRDGTLAFSATDKCVCVLHDLAAKRSVRIEDGGFDRCSSQYYFSDDGKRFLIVTDEPKSVWLRWFDPRTARLQGDIRLSFEEIGGTHGRHVGWHDDNTIFYDTTDGRRALLDCNSGKVRLRIGFARQPEQGTWHYRDIVFSSLVTATLHYTVAEQQYAILDAQDGRLLRRFRVKPAEPTRESLNGRVSPDGRLLAVTVQETADLDRITLYETASGRRRGELRAPHRLNDFDFAPDGKTLAMSCDDTTILIWDLDRPLSKQPPLPPPRDRAEAERLWTTLANANPELAEPALWALVRAPALALDVFRVHLQPSKPPDPARLRSLIAMLDSSNFRVRLAAADELTQHPEYALPALQAALAEAKSLEQRRRIEELLPRVEDIGNSTVRVRELRGLEALERIGTAEARKLVESLAAGDARALVTAEARVVLRRWR